MLTLEVFSHQYLLMFFHWSLSESKSAQVSNTLLSILANLNNAIVWMVSTHPVISKSSSPCTKITNYNLYKRHFHVPQFFHFPSKVEVLILLFAFFQFYSVVTARTAKCTIQQVLLLLLLLLLL